MKWYDPILMNVISLPGAGIIKLLLSSCNIVYIEGEDFPGNALYVSWHQRMSFLARFFSNKGLVIMVSQSRDGEYGARIAKRLGFKFVRGSSSKGAVRAMREMIRLIKEGNSAGILADGPVGPPRIAKIGSIIIAQKSKVPIIPISWGCDRGWILNSWDRYLIPKPFSNIVIRYGEPIFVPEHVSPKRLEVYRRKLQDALNECTDWCDCLLGVNIPWRKD